MTRSAAVARSKAAQSKSVGEGFISGVDTVGSGIVRGVGSLFAAPVQGAQKHGAAGFFKGLGKGVVGALVKPAVGVADAVSAATLHSAADHSAGQGVFAQRARPPRALGPRGEVLAFSKADADAQQQLAVLIQAGGKRLKPIGAGRYIAARPCGGPRAFGTRRLVVTTTHVLSLQLSGGHAGSSGGGVGGSSEQPTLEWFERLGAIATLEESTSELVLHLRDGGMRFVPCAAGARERREVFEMVDSALRSMQQE